MQPGDYSLRVSSSALSLVVCITGNGLKTQEAVTDHVGKPWSVKPNLESFEESYNKHIKG